MDSKKNRTSDISFCFSLIRISNLKIVIRQIYIIDKFEINRNLHNYFNRNTFLSFLYFQSLERWITNLIFMLRLFDFKLKYFVGKQVKNFDNKDC